MGSHFFDRFTGCFGRYGNGHDRRHGGSINGQTSPSRSSEAWSVETRQPTRMLVCPRCWADNKPDARFCNACGYALGQADIVCVECGHVLAVGAKVCAFCGQDVT
ncbi:ribosomal protein L40E [Beijerinckia sp. GAS462]|nr:ribosomal protein L40E [Beijerinckia sp. GAS462]SED35845.1 Double zinc ribbon [Beijerinckia sp. 28-YEA-48]